VKDGAQAALLAMMLVLPLSALVARRVPLGQTAKLAAIWVAVFAAAALVVTQVDRLTDRTGGDATTTSGAAVRIARDADGHYYAVVRVNDVERRMLIDSGATTTVLSDATAVAAGIDMEESTFPRMVDTANGSAIARSAHVARLRLGTIETRDLPVLVSDTLGDQDILGMNFLSRLKAWKVEEGVLILIPPDSPT
jgi:aspartyl protease family protein